jgi:hypothetical protein
MLEASPVTPVQEMSIPGGKSRLQPVGDGRIPAKAAFSGSVRRKVEKVKLRVSSVGLSSRVPESVLKLLLSIPLPAPIRDELDRKKASPAQWSKITAKGNRSEAHCVKR